MQYRIFNFIRRVAPLFAANTMNRAVHILTSYWLDLVTQETQLSLTNRATRLEVSHGTIPYVRYVL